MWKRNVILFFSTLTQSSSSASLLSLPRPMGAVQQPILRPGLYLLRLSNLQPNLIYIIFWPEESTWDDNASGVVSRNRTTFMRCVVLRCLQ